MVEMNKERVARLEGAVSDQEREHLYDERIKQKIDKNQIMMKMMWDFIKPR